MRYLILVAALVSCRANTAGTDQGTADAEPVAHADRAQAPADDTFESSVAVRQDTSAAVDALDEPAHAEASVVEVDAATEAQSATQARDAAPDVVADDAADGSEASDAGRPDSAFPVGDPCAPGTLRCASAFQPQVCNVTGGWDDVAPCECPCVPYTGTCGECVGD